MTQPDRLTWSDVQTALEPAARALTIETVAAIALPKIPPTRPTDRRFERDTEAAIDAAIQARFGKWSSGWRWARGEGSIGGGVVDGWCCGAHSLWRRNDRGPEPSAERAAAGLLSWRDWIAELAALFARTDEGPPALVFERRAHAVLARVVERTGAEDAWYGHAEQVLVWLLESLGEPSPEKAVARAIDGRFESWVAPSAGEQADVVLTLCDGSRIARKTPDALARWWQTRQTTMWPSDPQVIAGEGDSVLEHVVRHDAAIDEERGARMLSALERSRAFAASGADLTFAELTAWQAIVLGTEVALRQHDAWAKDGRERYAHSDKLGAQVETALRDACATERGTIARAARAYLDICFLHPFVDGNARLARLVLDYVLTRAGLRVADPQGLLFRVPLPADVPDIGLSFCATLSSLVRATSPRPGAEHL